MTARAAALLTAVALWAAPAGAQLAPLSLDLGANGLGLALRRLPVLGRVLYVTAHPDDENNGVQVRLSRGLGLRAGLLTLTRGEGGQNEIGSERGEELGVLRTEELAAVHRYDGAEQIFGRAMDFGFSFSVDETFERWGREETLGDVVRALRAFRPDVVLSLPIEAPGGGQHHQAAAQLAREAFRAAADPARFPEQIASGLRPWQARKLYEGGVGGGPAAREGERVVVPTGTFDPLLGMSWQQFGILARAMHRCQGVAQLRADPLTGDGVYTLVDAEPPVTGKEADILDGVDISLHHLLDFVPVGSPERAPLTSALDVIAADVTKAQASFDPRAPERTAASLAAGLGRLQRLREAVQSNGALAEATRFEIGDRLERKARDFDTALALAHALAFEARADQGLVVPGQSLGVTVEVWNQGGLAIVIDDVSLVAPAGWSVERQSGDVGPLGPRESRVLRYQIRVAAGAPATRPYWRRRSGGDRYDVDAPDLDGRPWGPPEVVARLRYTSLGGVAAHLEVPAIVRYEGRWVGGEKQRTVAVVPAVSLGVSPEVTVLPVEARSRVRAFRVRLTENGDTPAKATVRLEAPPGWRVEPAEAEVSFETRGQEVVTPFEVAPPAALSAGEVELRAVATQGAKEYREGFRAIAYDHIQERNVFRPATARLVALDVRTTPDVSVGYVMGTGDEVAMAVEELGVPVTLLGEADLASGDLSRFSTIVTGIRAFQVRPDLRAANPRLIRYAAAGGHVVVQYNRLDFNQSGGTDALLPAVPDSPYAPYPGFSVTNDRVTDETAPMRVLAGDRVLSLPNTLSPRDWEGWAQERGLNFAAVRDPRYANLLASTDPFPKNAGEKTGILVVATVGKGTWTYTGLSLFRQLPAGVPGAYRLLANLVGRPRGGR
jgi:hypothetical protein